MLEFHISSNTNYFTISFSPSFYFYFYFSLSAIMITCENIIVKLIE